MNNLLNLTSKNLKKDKCNKNKKLSNNNGIKVCLRWLRCSKFSVGFVPAKKETIFKTPKEIHEFNYSDYF